MPGETLLAFLARRTGVADAEAEVERHTAAWSPDAYAAALEHFLALGGGDLEHRRAARCADLGLPVSLDQETPTLSGGEAARAALAAILLSRFDVLLLDEPTNDLDFDGLDRLERFLGELRRSASRSSRTIAPSSTARSTRIAEIDPWTGRVREYAGGWSEYAAARELARGTAVRRLRATRRSARREVEALLNERRNQARAAAASSRMRPVAPTGAERRRSQEGAPGRAGARADRARREAVRALAAAPLARCRQRPGTASPRSPAPSASEAPSGSARSTSTSRRASGSRSPGRNGSGKSTLLALLLGELPLAAGRRASAAPPSLGALDQRRPAYDGEGAVARGVPRPNRPAAGDARTLLAKFNLGADHVARPCTTLSPGERTRAHLAELTAPASTASSSTSRRTISTWRRSRSSKPRSPSYEGTPVVVSHDRRFLEAVAPTRSISRCSYTRQPLMAVPKKKTSKARRDKRRAQHGIEAPRVNVCPTCHQPKRPHRVCPTCHTYKGREIEPLRTPAP